MHNHSMISVILILPFYQPWKVLTLLVVYATSSK